MKFKNFVTYLDTRAGDSVPAPYEYAFCLRIINADYGFKERATTYTTFGTEPDPALSIVDTTLQCDCPPDNTLYFDPELLSCVDITD